MIWSGSSSGRTVIELRQPAGPSGALFTRCKRGFLEGDKKEMQNALAWAEARIPTDWAALAAIDL